LILLLSSSPICGLFIWPKCCIRGVVWWWHDKYVHLKWRWHVIWLGMNWKAWIVWIVDYAWYLWWEILDWWV